ncbi:MAG: hypothetical protein KF822_12645 [Steroidobacteraceae bacterium]|nr:hypothetical protein [Steroidobacteraceae bacterium]
MSKRTADEIARDVLFGTDGDRAKLTREVLELNTQEQANYLRRLYRATRNNLIVWQIYALYRQAKLPIPEDVLRMLDRFGETLQTASGAKEIAQALGLTGEKGGAQSAAALAKAIPHLHLVTAVYIRMEHDKTLPAAHRWSQARIFAQVAKEMKTTAGAVKSAWGRHVKTIQTKRAGEAGTIDTIAAALRPRKVR